MEPSESWASFLYDWANRALILGLVIGAIATPLIVWMGNIKERHLRKELADTNERAARANERAAVLEKETVLLGPRAPLLWGSKRDEVTGKLKEFTGQKVEVRFCSEARNKYFMDRDSVSLAEGLRILLKEANWSANPVLEDGCGSGIGIVVTVNPKAPEASRKAAKALVDSLSSFPFKVSSMSPFEAESTRIPQPRLFEQVDGVQKEILVGPLEPDRIVVLVMAHP